MIFYFNFFKYKSRNLSKIVSVLLSASVERFFVSRMRDFWFGSGLKLPRKKKFFFADFALQNMVETTLPDGLETSGQRVYR